MATPSIVVNGRYVTESGRVGLQGMFLVVNHLIERERNARADAEAPASEEGACPLGVPTPREFAFVTHQAANQRVVARMGVFGM